MTEDLLSVSVTPDWEAFVRCIGREGTPERVHFIELFLDPEVQTAICERYGLLRGLDSDDPFFAQRRTIALQRFLSYDFVRCGLEGMEWPMKRHLAEDTAELQREGGRRYIEELEGPITNWEEFDAYPWPDPTHGRLGAGGEAVVEAP